MRLVLSLSEKAVRALRVLAAEQGCRGVSAFVESVYGGDPPVAVHKASMLAALMEKIAAQGPGELTPVKGELTPEENALAWENIKRLGLVPSEQVENQFWGKAEAAAQGPPVAPFVGGVGKLVAGGIVPDPIVAEEGTLGAQWVDLDGAKHVKDGKMVLKEVPGEGHG